MFRSASILGGLLLVVSSTLATRMMAQDEAPEQEQPAAEASAEDIGYFLGFATGQNMLQQGFKEGDFNTDRLGQGLADALAGGEPKLSNEQLGAISAKVESILQERQKEIQAEMEKAAAANKKITLANKEKSDLFMEQNAKKDGVETLAEGLQYTVIESGDGASPGASDTVKVNYVGRLTSGKVFDSSEKQGKPAVFRVGGVIPGWTQALQKMKVGDKWTLFIAPELAYRERGVPGPPGGEPVIGPNEVLVFEIELLEIL